MSVKDMIGADVETGGLFDPLGERLRRRKDCSGTVVATWAECGVVDSWGAYERFDAPPFARNMIIFFQIQTFNRSAHQHQASKGEHCAWRLAHVVSVEVEIKRLSAKY